MERVAEVPPEALAPVDFPTARAQFVRDTAAKYGIAPAEIEATLAKAQFLDSVNVPPPGPAAEIWAPVGLRYHALHHLMPSMPYHDLPEAHRRLARELGTGSTYEGANHPGMLVLVGLSWAFFTHMMSGLRHFVLDIGAGYELDTNRLWSIAAPIIAVLLTAGFWALILLR